MTGDFDCEAYGPEGREHGALCFTAGQGQRACPSREDCHRVMAAERQRVFGRIHEMAAEGDPAGVFLAGEFTDPGQILGGGEQP
jgi:hypothetical protein